MTESPTDMNTRASVSELLEPLPEKSAISIKKSANPEEVPVAQTRAEHELELGEIPGSTTTKSVTSFRKSTIVGLVQAVPKFTKKSRRGADPESAILDSGIWIGDSD